MVGTGMRTCTRRLRVPRAAVIAVAVSTAVALAPAGPTVWAAAGPPRVVPGQAVPVHAVAAHPVKVPPMPVSRLVPVVWPAAGTGTASLPAQAAPVAATGGDPTALPAGATAGSAQVGTTPVWVGPAATQDTASTAAPRQATTADQVSYPPYAEHGPLAARPAGAPNPAAPAAPATGTPSVAASPTDRTTAAAIPVRSAHVTVLPHRTATGLGITGAVFSVTRADGTSAPGTVHVSVDYTGFRSAYGGDYAARLHLVELPACALTTPGMAACRQQTALSSADDVTTNRIGADVTLSGGAAVVLAATTSAQGSGGDYAAEPVSEMDQWISGNSSGTYRYSYPIDAPLVPGGLRPDASLQYDSQLTDGVTAATNPGASEVGDGWQSPAPGYLEVDYQTCAANFNEPDILDLCNQVQEESLTQGGATTAIVLSTGNNYKEEGDDGSAVQQLSGGGWEVIGSNGTRSYYGLNKLPGWVTGDAQTNSAWTVPLWAGNTEQSTAAPWRYMLDYVVDAKGNAIAYFYNTQTNSYATHGGSTANGPYTAGGVLAKVEYGLRDNGNIYTQTPAAEIDYTYATTARTPQPTSPAPTAPPVRSPRRPSGPVTR